MGTLDNLDIESAVAAHSMWYKRFEQAILGIDADKLKELSVDDDTKCVLGCWLHMQGNAGYASLPIFQRVVIAHREFHQDAQRIVEFLLTGDVDKAEDYMATHFQEISSHLVGLLEDLRQQVG